MKWPLSLFLPVFLAPAFLFDVRIDAKREVVINTSTLPYDMEWDSWSPDDSSSGWTEETYSWNNENYRLWTACFADPKVIVNRFTDNWLFTPVFRESGVKRFRLTVSYSIRECPYLDEAKKVPAPFCKELFEVYSHPVRRGQHRLTLDELTRNSKVDTTVGGLWQLTFKAAGNGPIEIRDDNVKMHTGTEWKDFPVNDSFDGVAFAFHDAGSCTSLLSITITYDVCDAGIRSLAIVNKTHTAASAEDYIAVEAECVPGAEPAIPGKKSILNCKSDGTWDVPQGNGCVCKAGFERRGDSCVACPFGKYSERGSESCKKCPPNSSGAINGVRSRCKCENGWFRLDENDPSGECYGSPSEPQNLAVSAVEQTSLTLSWDSPHSNGNRQNVWYEVVCTSCSEEEKKRIKQKPEHGNDTRVRMVNMQPETKYVFEVIALNDISSRTSRHSSSSVTSTTRPLASHTVGRLRVDSETDSKDSLILGWDAIGPKAKYEVEMKYNGETRIFEAMQTNYQTGSLDKGELYIFRVRANIQGWGQWSDALSYKAGQGVMSFAERTTPVNGESSSNQSPVYAVKDLPTWVLLLVCALLILLLIFLALIFRKKSNNRKQMSDLDVLDTYKQDTMTPDYNSAHRQPFNGCFKPSNTTKLNAPLISYGDRTPQSGSSGYGPAGHHNRFKPYVDPLAYEDPNQALSEFAFDIPPEAVKVTAVIGGGEFGDVCKAQLNTSLLRRTTVGAALIASGYEGEFESVACKTLKPGSGPKAKADFLLEASIMGQFVHPNVVRLIGVVTKAEPVMIVAEYMAHGSLDQFLRTRDANGRHEEIGLECLLRMLAGVAAGMRYLTDKGFVHRDLAARNVLVDENLMCKIADFGLSRGVDKLADQEYTTNGGKIPVRWTAPEAITHRKFTAASDVWSFGVVMWEVCSYGERPYWEWTNQKVISEIMAGYRLPAPMDTPSSLHRLMLWCWQLERHDRPTFAQLFGILERYVAQPELVYESRDNTSSLGGSSGDGRVRSLANLSAGAYCTTSVVPGSPALGGYGNHGERHHERIPAPPASAPPPAPPLDEFLRSLGLGSCMDRLTRAGVTRCEQLARMHHLDALSCGLITEEFSRIRDALSQLRLASSNAPYSSSTSTLLSSSGSPSTDRPVPPRRPTLSTAHHTVATLPSRHGGHRSRGDDQAGFFV